MDALMQLLTGILVVAFLALKYSPVALTKKGRQRENEALSKVRLNRWQRRLAQSALVLGITLFAGAFLVRAVTSVDYCLGQEINPLMVTHKCWDDEYTFYVALTGAIFISVAGGTLVLSWSNRPEESPPG